jgi:cytochrome c5
MFARRAATAIVVCAALLALAATTPKLRVRHPLPPAPRKIVFTATLPAGEGHDLAERSCLMCHSAMLITQQAKDSAGWERTLVQMEKWGVPLTPAEHDTVRNYFLSNFGARGR